MIEFYQRKLEEARERSLAASREGDLKAWELAEVDVKNYEEMLRRSKAAESEN